MRYVYKCTWVCDGRLILLLTYRTYSSACPDEEDTQSAIVCFFLGVPGACGRSCKDLSHCSMTGLIRLRVLINAHQGSQLRILDPNNLRTCNVACWAAERGCSLKAERTAFPERGAGDGDTGSRGRKTHPFWQPRRGGKREVESAGEWRALLRRLGRHQGRKHQYLRRYILHAMLHFNITILSRMETLLQE